MKQHTLKEALYSVIFAVFLTACLGACSGNDKPVPGAPCEADVDCPTGFFCTHQECVSPSQINCIGTGCPPGYLCLSNGSCLAGAECEVDSDCCALSDPNDPLGCDKKCTNSKCVGFDCNDTDPPKKCFVGCHEGTQICSSGVVQPCSAPLVLLEEACGDGIDNDCNGATDDGCPVCAPGDMQLCTTACGDGQAICKDDAQWGDCSAPRNCYCDPPGSIKTEACGTCGFQEFVCGSQGVWDASELCTGQGECEVGEQEFVGCGNCGQQTRVCGPECVWTEWSECLGGDCVEGDTEERACGLCGSESRSCGSSCQWSTWSGCVEGGGCQEGEAQTQNCGLCGSKTSMCNNQCEWGPFGVCQGEGMCTVGEIETVACENCGHKTRTCGDDCQWSQWGECEGWGECSVGNQDTDNACGPESDVGICQFGARYRSCAATCQWNPWSECAGAVFPSDEVCGDGIDQDCDGIDPVNPDPFEHNNTCATAFYLGEDPSPASAECIKESPSDFMGFCSYDGTTNNKTWKSCFSDDDCSVIRATFDNPDDNVDFYYFKGNDSSFNVSENIVVELKNQPIGADADIYLYRSYDCCVNNANCEDSPQYIAYSLTVGSGDEELSWGEAFLTDDGGYYYVRVENYEGSDCYDDYELTIDGLR